MGKQYEVALSVNNNTIELTPFPADFLANVTVAAVLSLKDVDDIKTLELYEDDGNIRIIANSKPISITAFLNDYVANTINGLISTLRGVEDIKTVKIDIEALS